MGGEFSRFCRFRYRMTAIARRFTAVAETAMVGMTGKAASIYPAASMM